MFLQGSSQGLAKQNPQHQCEDTDTSVVGYQVDPFSLPLKSTADALIASYFSTVHLSLPVINKADFLFHYEQLANTIEPSTYPDRTFMAKLHLVLAIGAVHAHPTEAEWAGDERGNMLYFVQLRT